MLCTTTVVLIKESPVFTGVHKQGHQFGRLLCCGWYLKQTWGTTTIFSGTWFQSSDLTVSVSRHILMRSSPEQSCSAGGLQQYDGFPATLIHTQNGHIPHMRAHMCINTAHGSNQSILCHFLAYRPQTFDNLDSRARQNIGFWEAVTQ